MRWLIQKIFAEVIDAVTLLGKVNHQITFKRNEIVNNALSEDYKTICGQDHSESKELLGDNLADNVKKKRLHVPRTSKFQIKGWYYILVFPGIQHLFPQATQRLASVQPIL